MSGFVIVAHKKRILETADFREHTAYSWLKYQSLTCFLHCLQLEFETVSIMIFDIN